MSRRLATATIFSRSSAPSSPLIRLSVPRSTSSAPSVVRSIRRCSAKDVSGIPAAAAWAAVPSDVGMSRKRRPSRCRCARASTGRRRAGTEPDDHAVADQLRSRLCRGALERVVLGAGAVSRAAQGSAANCCCGGCWRWPPGNPASRKLSSRRRWSLRRPPPVPRWGDLRRRPSIIGCRSRSAHVARRARILGDTSGRKP
jgi:hypothetical protein